MSSPTPPIKATCRIAVAMAGLLCLASQSALAATQTWVGGGTGNNMRQGPNWASGTIPAVGDDLVFAGTIRPTPNNNNSAVQGVFSSITFNSTATNFLIVGAATPALTISNGITNNSVNTQTISNGITLGNNITVAASSGNINLALALGDAGAGRGITKTGSATLTLSGTNTYTGATTISDGAVVLSAGGSLSTNSALDLAGATARFDIAGLTASGSTNASLAGVAGSVVNLGSKNFDVGGDNTSTTFAGTITNTGSLTKRGSGTLTLSGANTYTGGTVISNGTLLFTNGGSVAGNITNNATLSITRTDSSTLSNVVSGTGSLTKAGAGTLTLPGVNALSGATTVEQGTLVVNGSLNNSAVTVQSGAILGGSGSIGTLTLNGILAPGNSAGQMDAGTTGWNQGGSYDWEIFNLADAPGSSWDWLNITNGSLNLSGITAPGGFTINLITLTTNNATPGPLDGFNAATNYSNWLIASAPSISGFSAGNFNLNTNSFVGATGIFAIEQRAYGGGQGLFVTYTGAGEPIPEPSTWAAAALLTGVAWFVRRRRARARTTAVVNSNPHLPGSRMIHP